MNSQPTMLHLRAAPYALLLRGVRVPMLPLIERVGNGWGKSRTDALCLWPGADAFTAGLRAGDTLLVQLHDLHAHEGHMRGSVLQEPRLLPRSTPAAREQPSNQEQTANAAA